jgi:hypothetical protein
MGQPMSDMVFEAWLHIGLDPTKETFVLVSPDPSYESRITWHPKIGTSRLNELVFCSCLATTLRAFRLAGPRLLW